MFLRERVRWRAGRRRPTKGRISDRFSYRQTTRTASSFDAAAENGPVKSVVYSYTNKDEDGNVTSGNMSFTFAYGDASVTTPDLTEWELIVIGE